MNKKKLLVVFLLMVSVPITHYIVYINVSLFVMGVGMWQFDNPHLTPPAHISFLLPLGTVMMNLLILPSTLLVNLNLVPMGWEFIYVPTLVFYTALAIFLCLFFTSEKHTKSLKKIIKRS